MRQVARIAAATTIVIAAVLVSASPASAATAVWDGGGADDNWTTAANWANDTAPTAADTLVFPDDALRKTTNTNDFPADTVFTIQIAGTGYQLDGARITLGGGSNTVGGPTNDIALDLLVSAVGRTLDGAGGEVTGDVELAEGASLDAGNVVFNSPGVISGAGSLTTRGTTLNGANTYTGATSVGTGTTKINGSQPSSAVSIINGSNGVLGGDGTIGALNGGDTGSVTLAATEQLTVNGNYVSGPAVQRFAFTGSTPGSNQGQLVVNGTVTLTNGVNLQVNDPAPTVDPGTELVLIANDGTDPVSGQFTYLDETGEGEVLAEGDIDQFGGNGIYELSYAGGDGNDVSITAIAVPLIAVGPASGATELNVFVFGDRAGGFDPYGEFNGGFNVAMGDVDADGISDLITAPRAGGGPHIQVFFGDDQERGFMAYDPAFRGGVSVAAADIDNDGRDEIITGAGPGGAPHVRAFEIDGTPVSGTGGGFFAYSTAFTGGVNVGGLRRTGSDAILTGVGDGGGPHVRILEGDGTEVTGFMAYDPAFRGGVQVAGLLIGGDPRVVTSPGPGGGPHIRVFGTGGAEQSAFMAYDPALRTGFFLAAFVRPTGNTQDIIVGPAAGGPHVRVLTAAGAVQFEFMARDILSGGATVAGGAVR
jgi:hypothetical protein